MMMATMRNLHCLIAGLLLLCLMHRSDSANVRGSSSKLEELKERVLHPNIKPEHRGKTLQQILGDDMVDDTRQQYQRKMQGGGNPTFGQPTYSYFALYDEFGPAFTTLGDTAGVRGTIYSNDARMNGLTEEFIEGSLDGTCSSVASKGTLLCTYELFFLDSETGFMATLVATGSVSLELFQPNLLMVEATGDDFGYKNGLLSLTYTAGGAQPVVEIDIIV